MKQINRSLLFALVAIFTRTPMTHTSKQPSLPEGLHHGGYLVTFFYNTKKITTLNNLKNQKQHKTTQSTKTTVETNRQQLLVKTILQSPDIFGEKKPLIQKNLTTNVTAWVMEETLKQQQIQLNLAIALAEMHAEMADAKFLLLLSNYHKF